MVHISGHPVRYPAFRADDGGLTLLGLRARYEGVLMWFGEATRHYWALVGGRLIEAGTLGDLEALLRESATPHRRTHQPMPRSFSPSEPTRIGAPRHSDVPPLPHAAAPGIDRCGIPSAFVPTSPAVAGSADFQGRDGSSLASWRRR